MGPTSEIRRVFGRAAGALALLAALGPVTCAAAAGVADDGNKIIQECLLKDRVSGVHSQQAYQYALAHLPSDVTEYSDCGDVIRRAQLAAAGGGGPDSAGGAFRDPYATATRAEKAAIVHAQRTHPTAVAIGGRLVRPGLVGVAPASVFTRLPGPLLAALIAICLPALALGAYKLRETLARRRP